MRRLVLLLALLVACLAAAPASAPGYVVGFSEQQADMFTTPLFQDLRVRHARLIVSYDAVLRNTIEVQDVERWLTHAREARVTRPLVSFNYSRGCYVATQPRGRRIPRTSACRLPSVSRYRTAIRAFLRRFPAVRVVSPWNEANHESQPTDKKPRRAAEYYNAMRSLCRGCTIVAADVLDEPDVDVWLRSFLRYAVRPRIWGLHNYSDTNRFRATGTRKVLRTVKGDVWLTETGGVVQLGNQCAGITEPGSGCSFPYDEERAARATSYMFRLARSNRRIKRLYIYQWSGAPRDARFDAGVIGPDGRPRPAYDVIRRQLRR